VLCQFLGGDVAPAEDGTHLVMCVQQEPDLAYEFTDQSMVITLHRTRAMGANGRDGSLEVLEVTVSHPQSVRRASLTPVQ
jgi:hypothetical protein